MNLRSVLTVAGITVLTAAAAYSANATIREARIPFAFRAGLASMPAGSYEVTLESHRAVPVIRLRNTATGQNAMVMAVTSVAADDTLSGNDARLVFLCAASDCAFNEVQPGRGSNGYQTRAPKFRDQMGFERSVPKNEVTRMVVPITRAD